MLSAKATAMLKMGARGLGLDIRRYRPSWPPDARRLRIFQEQGINLVLDVGANRGSYGESLRTSGFGGRIVSFEPASAPFMLLQRLSRNDSDWDCHKLALGSRNEAVSMRISSNTYSNSILQILPMHERAAPESRVIGEEIVTMHRLDDLAHEIGLPGSSPFLKIDTQGYELEVLEGASECLRLFKGIELEVSLAPLYDGQPLFKEVVDYMYERSFALHSLEPGWYDPSSGMLLQFDGLFVRKT